METKIARAVDDRLALFDESELDRVFFCCCTTTLALPPLRTLDCGRLMSKMELSQASSRKLSMPELVTDVGGVSVPNPTLPKLIAATQSYHSAGQNPKMPLREGGGLHSQMEGQVTGEGPCLFGQTLTASGFIQHRRRRMSDNLETLYSRMGICLVNELTVLADFCRSNLWRLFVSYLHMPSRNNEECQPACMLQGPSCSQRLEEDKKTVRSQEHSIGNDLDRCPDRRRHR